MTHHIPTMNTNVRRTIVFDILLLLSVSQGTPRLYSASLAHILKHHSEESLLTLAAHLGGSASLIWWGCETSVLWNFSSPSKCPGLSVAKHRQGALEPSESSVSSQKGMPWSTQEIKDRERGREGEREGETDCTRPERAKTQGGLHVW